MAESYGDSLGCLESLRRATASSPRLTRRARGRGLALIIRGAPGFDQAMRDWYVLPINEESGELDEPVRLYGSDLEGIDSWAVRGR